MLDDFLVITLLMVGSWETTWALEGPIVEVEQGRLQGKNVTSVEGKTFYSFQGIPYAAPPVRFKDAQPPKSWKGVRDATQLGSKCTQLDADTSTYEGCEDCLFLNVYTPQLPEPRSEPLAVMFWIHGGGFVFGSGDDDIYGPDYLVDEDIILVTINYRLSCFGFLFLNDAVPGNVGLKDQVCALRWVQKNIHSFNGDPNKVTIFGESAGGTSVNWHMLSPMSKGLFQRGISQSGAILWDMQWEPYKTSLNLARVVGCPDRPDEEVAACLRRVDHMELIKASETEAALPRDRDRMMTFTFNPTVEERHVRGVELFVTGTPEELMRHGCQHNVPYMTGINNEEWMLTVAMNKTIFESEENLKHFDSNWTKYIFPETRIPDNSKQVPEAMNDLRKFYLHGEPLTYANFKGYQDMLSDLQTAFSMYYELKYMPQTHKSDIYVYSFTADQDLNFLKKNFNMIYPGASHADEMGYEFKVHFLPEVPPDNPSYLTRKIVVRLFTNFAKYGNPTQFYDPLIGKIWKRYTSDKKNYLEIGNEIKTGKDLNEDRVKFLFDFYNKYGEKGEVSGWTWKTCLCSLSSFLTCIKSIV